MGTWCTVEKDRCKREDGLRAEIERLRAEIERLRAKLADYRQLYYQTRRQLRNCQGTRSNG